MDTLKAIIAVWLSFCLIGFIAGKARSPDFSSYRNIQDFIEVKSKVWVHEEKYSTLSMLLLNVPESRRNRYWYSTEFKSGDDLYSYSLSKDTVIKRTVMKEAKIHRNDFTRADINDFSKVLGIPSIYVSYSSFLVMEKSPKTIALVMLGAATGFGVGMYLGYNEEFTDAQRVMAEQILYDKLFWRKIIKDRSAQGKLYTY